MYEVVVDYHIKVRLEMLEWLRKEAVVFPDFRMAEPIDHGDYEKERIAIVFQNSSDYANFLLTWSDSL